VDSAQVAWFFIVCYFSFIFTVALSCMLSWLVPRDDIALTNGYIRVKGQVHTHTSAECGFAAGAFYSVLYI
jgi:hypothetical protein